MRCGLCESRETNYGGENFCPECGTRLAIDERDKENTLVVIGYMSQRRCYMNVSMKHARMRFIKEGNEIDEERMMITEFRFKDSFSAYDAWEDEG